MKKILTPPLSIEVRLSEIDGYGVFAAEDIPKGKVLEDCYYVPMQDNWKDMDIAIKNYVFMCGVLKSPKEEADSQRSSYILGAGAQGMTRYKSACVLGNGMIYNHSTHDHNVEYTKDFESKVFTFYTTRDVFKDEELFIHYGDGSNVMDRIKKGLG